MAYSYLFSPSTIRGMEMQSKVIMGSMHVGLEGEENGLEKLTAFYVRRAKEHVD